MSLRVAALNPPRLFLCPHPQYCGLLESPPAFLCGQGAIRGRLTLLVPGPRASALPLRRFTRPQDRKVEQSTGANSPSPRSSELGGGLANLLTSSSY